MRNAEAAVASTRAQRAVQVANLRQAELAFERQKTMIADEATSKADYEAAEATPRHDQSADPRRWMRRSSRARPSSTRRRRISATRRSWRPMDGTIVAVVCEGRADGERRAVRADHREARESRHDDGERADLGSGRHQGASGADRRTSPILGNPDKRYYGKLRTIEPAPESVQTETTATAHRAARRAPRRRRSTTTASSKCPTPPASCAFR